MGNVGEGCEIHQCTYQVDSKDFHHKQMRKIKGFLIPFKTH